MARKQDWKPGDRPGSKTDVELLLATGDDSPFIVYRKEGVIHAEYWWRNRPRGYLRYRWEVEPNVLRDLDWVDEPDRVASFIGMSEEDFKAEARSADPLKRAWNYEAIGSYYGFENMDGYPDEMTAADLNRLWPYYPEES